MRKKLLTLLMAILMLAVLIVPASAETDTDTFSVDTYSTHTSVWKFYDKNLDGAWDASIDPWIVGWKFEALDDQGNVLDTKYTNESGYVTFASGFYEIREVMPAGGCWVMTTPEGYTVNGRRKFGNVCLGYGGGLTPGFWSNKNGQKEGGDDLARLTGLNLKNRDGSDFDPASYTEFSNWLLDANAVNMANMLSVQLAAMELNVINGKVSGNAMIYAPGTQGANDLGFATVNAVMTEANSELDLHSLTLSGSEFRAYQEDLKNALDNANNNLSFVQKYPCTFSY
jgi:hypothetical protein